ncbi:MAG: hypothetical protein ACO33E_05225 [Aquiluna sp.]|jgi:hypothetical protein
MLETGALNQQEVELDTDGLQDQEVTIEQKQEESTEPKIYSGEVEPEGTAVNQHKDDKIQVELAEETTEEIKKPKDDLDKYSKGVQERITELTKKRKFAERDRDAALDFARAAKRELDEIRSKFPKVEADYLKEYEARVTADELSAQQELDRAIQEQDGSAIAKANQKLIRVAIDREKVNNAKILRQEKEESYKAQQISQPVGNQPQNTQPLQPSAKAQAWAEENPWFGDDEVMTDAAFALDKKIKSEGIVGDSEMYYNELNRRLKEYFPGKFSVEENKPTEQRKPVQTVASAQRNQSGRKTVKLTKSQLAVARRLGVSPEDYAKYVK